MKSKNTIWFIESGVTLFALTCFSLQRKSSKNLAYIINTSYSNELSVRKNILKKLKNVELISVIDDINFSKNINRFQRSKYIRNILKKCPKNYVITTRAGSNINKFLSPFTNKYTLIHGIEDYLNYSNNNNGKLFNIKKFIIRLIAYILYSIFGFSILNRNFGKKISFKLKQISNKNSYSKFYLLDTQNEELKLYFIEYFIKLENYRNSNKFKNNKLKIISYLPISPNSLNIEYDLNLERKFIDFNKEILIKFRNYIKENICIFINLHPIDLTIKKTNKNYNFINLLIKELKENSFDVSIITDFVDMTYCHEISYEMTEIFLKPNYLVSSYLSAALITSQLPPHQKYLVDYDQSFISNMIPELDKAYSLVNSDNFVFNRI